MKSIVAVVVVALLVPIALDGQQQPAGKAAIRGRILAGDTGRPLRRAQLTLTSPQGGAPRTASTNLEGRYEFKDLPPGRYTLSVRRSGYLPLQYGQQRPGELARPLQMNADQIAENVDFTLPRMGSIVGRVLDDAGEPLAGVLVWAMRPMFIEGQRRLAQAATNGFVGTDDSGEFRMTGLAPGTYYLRAMTNETWTVLLDGKRQLMGFAPTFHPGVARVTEARPIDVGLGQRVITPDLMLIPARPANISGIALDSRGQPITGRPVGLSIRFIGALGGGVGGGGSSVASAPLGADGSFLFHNVPAGEYELTVATATANVRQGEGETARLSIVIDGTDLNDVRLITSAGWTAAGRVVTDEGTPPPFPSQQARVFSQLIDDVRAASQAVGALREDWTFTVRPIIGRARLLATVPDGWMVTSIHRDGREIPEILEFGSGQHVDDFEVVVSNRVTTVTGQLADDRGMPLANGTVVVFAEDSSKWGVGSRFVRAVRPDQQGRWEVKGLPSGQYLAAARDYVEELSWNDPVFLESLRVQAQRVLLAEGASHSVSLRIVNP